MEVEQTSELSPCELCNKFLLLQGLEAPAEDRHKRPGRTRNRVSYDELTASAAHGCEACAVLCTVFQSYESESSEQVSITYHASSQHPIDVAVYSRDKVTGLRRATRVRLYTTESRLLFDVISTDTS